MDTKPTQQNWKDFCDGIIWSDLRTYLLERIDLNRDLLEGIAYQTEENKETDEALRGRCREARELISIIEGWASGEIPIAEVDPQHCVQPLNKGEEDAY